MVRTSVPSSVCSSYRFVRSRLKFGRTKFIHARFPSGSCLKSMLAGTRRYQTGTPLVSRIMTKRPAPLATPSSMR